MKAKETGSRKIGVNLEDKEKRCAKKKELVASATGKHADVSPNGCLKDSRRTRKARKENTFF